MLSGTKTSPASPVKVPKIFFGLYPDSSASLVLNSARWAIPTSNWNDVVLTSPYFHPPITSVCPFSSDSLGIFFLVLDLYRPPCRVS